MSAIYQCARARSWAADDRHRRVASASSPDAAGATLGERSTAPCPCSRARDLPGAVSPPPIDAIVFPIRVEVLDGTSARLKDAQPARRWAWIDIRMPNPASRVTTDVPPYESRGIGTPTTGSSPATMPPLTST